MATFDSTKLDIVQYDLGNSLDTVRLQKTDEDFMHLVRPILPTPMPTLT